MSLKRITAIIALFLAFCPFPASAQKHKFIHYGMENGMSSFQHHIQNSARQGRADVVRHQ